MRSAEVINEKLRPWELITCAATIGNLIRGFAEC